MKTAIIRRKRVKVKESDAPMYWAAAVVLSIAIIAAVGYQLGLVSLY